MKLHKQTIFRMVGASLEWSHKEDLVALAMLYFKQNYKCSDAERVSAAKLLEEYTLGKPIQDNHPAGKYAREVIAWVFSSSSLGKVEMAETVFRLIEAIYFKARETRAAARRAQMMTDAHYGEPVSKPETEAERRQVIVDAIALLEATKVSFKSKLVAEAKEKLQALL